MSKEQKLKFACLFLKQKKRKAAERKKNRMLKENSIVPRDKKFGLDTVRTRIRHKQTAKITNMWTFFCEDNTRDS